MKEKAYQTGITSSANFPARTKMKTQLVTSLRRERIKWRYFIKIKLLNGVTGQKVSEINYYARSLSLHVRERNCVQVLKTGVVQSTKSRKG
jgi:hypothetical protein